MLTPKENVLRMIYDEKPEYVPFTFEAFKLIGMPLAPALEEPLARGDAYDPWGVLWHVDSLGGMPDNRHFMFEDISEWEKYVKVPDISHVDFKGMAEKELEGFDREQQLLTFYHPVGIWERMAAFMGFENSCMALLEDPDSCHDFFDAVIKYHIDVAKHIIDAYHPDVYVYFNDVATAQRLFMSPDTWRELIQPHEKELVDYVNSRGVLFEQHCCGYTQDIIEDYVNMGVRLWHSAQSQNDLAEIERKYRGKLTVEGGWNSQGRPGMIDATDDDVRKEVKRCIDEYGHEGGFILLPTLVSEEGNAVVSGTDKRLPAFMDEYMKWRML